MKPEELVQQAIVDFVAKCCPKVLLSASQNGMYAGKGKFAGLYVDKQKRLGMLPGEPDLMLTWSLKNILFVEVKSADGKISDNQEKVISKRRGQGFDCEIVYSLDDFMEVVCKYRIPCLHPFIRKD